MNWLHFLLWLAGFYTLYYLAMVLWDVAGAKRAPAANSKHELTFSENVAPKQIVADEPVIDEQGQNKWMNKPAEARANEPEIIGSGGVIIDNLFKLCRQEAVNYTRSVSF